MYVFVDKKSQLHEKKNRYTHSMHTSESRNILNEWTIRMNIGVSQY